MSMSKEKRLRKEIKEDLINQLSQKGLLDKYYLDLVDDYMNLWDIKNMLNKDIKSRGVVVEQPSIKGMIVKKKNESCDQLLKTNKQMTSLLEYLNINPKENILGDEDDEL